MKHKSHLYNPYVWAIVMPFVLIYAIKGYIAKSEDMKIKYVNIPYLQLQARYASEAEKMALLTAKCSEEGSHVEKDKCVYSQAEFKARVKMYFPNSYKDMLAIIPAEGGWTMNKQNWNCYYEGYWQNYKRTDGATGKRAVITDYTPLKVQTEGVISTSCQKKADRPMAWSTDCFLLQKSYKGRLTCPEGVTLDQHLAEVADMTQQGGLLIFSSVWANNHLSYK